MSYKLLYLPTAEEILISKGFFKDPRSKIIKIFINSSIKHTTLSAPRSKINELEGPQNDNDDYKLAVFNTKKIVLDWLNELINRRSCKIYNLLLEHFDVIKII
jgi:hypothetical protein